MNAPRCPRPFVAGCGALIALLLAFTTAGAQGRDQVRPLTHENIVIDGNLSDLIGAVGRNPDAGCTLTSPQGNIYTQACTFVNGYDILNGYVFLDFEDAQGNAIPNYTLYAGWQVTGIIGDYDGDGNPDVFSNTQGGCAIPGDETGTNRSGRTGIGNFESYTVEFRDCATGELFRIGVKDNQVINFENNQPIAGATYARNGAFLEVMVPNVQQNLEQDLCDLSISLTSNAEFDGLGEDRTTNCEIEVPISIEVTKTPDTQAVCAGQNATFTITVRNNGACVIDRVRVDDVLGTGITFVSANPAPTSGSGSNRTWEFTGDPLEPGETITISLTAQVTGTCNGVPFRNDVTVEGFHDVNEAACPGRLDRSTTDTDFAEVTCLPAPCVDLVSCDAPDNACGGQPFTINASARNCGSTSANILLEILGPGGAVIHSQTFNNVGAGQTVNTSFQTSFSCTPGQSQTYSARATATNECGASTPVTSSGCVVQCGALPCVDAVSCTAPQEACTGSPITIQGSARNCGGTPANITLEILGPGGAVLHTQTFNNVGAGQTVNTSFQTTFSCTPGQSQTYSARARGSNECGQSNQVTSSGCTVQCGALPCVDAVSCTAPQNGCAGQLVTIQGSARNCGGTPANITLEILGPGGAVLHTQTFNNVGAGQSVNTSFQTTLNCTPGQNQTYTARARASNDCGQSNQVTSSGCTIQCGAAPCVTVVCEAPDQGANGQPITISGIATNCGSEAEQITITLRQNGNNLGSHTFFVQPGNQARFDTTFTFVCTENQTVSYSASAVATNQCGPGSPVQSQQPCVVLCQPQGEGCPRTVGFWGQQTRGLDNGSSKFTEQEMQQIAACIDQRLGAFNWADDLQSLDEVLNPSKPLNCEKQALRQIAGLLANICAGQLGFVADNGDSIFLDEDAANPCRSAFPDAATIGDLIDELDDALVDLQNEDARSNDNRWCAVSGCADDINNGRGINLACGDEDDDDSDDDGDDLRGSVEQMLQISQPAPNPFSQSTQVDYTVATPSPTMVRIGIYDVSGRLVRELVNQMRSPGDYFVQWDGRDVNGAQVNKGVYFVRAQLAGTRLPNGARILYLR